MYFADIPEIKFWLQSMYHGVRTY